MMSKMIIPVREGLWVNSINPQEKPQLIGSRCGDCGEIFFPKRWKGICLNCQKTKIEDILLSRRGKIYSFTIVMQGRPQPAPYKGPVHNPTHVEVSARQAWEMSGLGPSDIDVVQSYDTMAPCEIWDLEMLGFCKKGEAVHLLREGAFDLGGKLPVNTDGGLLSRGHPLGATGLAQIIEIVTQLRGDAGGRQIPKARIGLANSMGAGPNSAITILKRN
jgi:hypothetical protein